MPFMLIVGAGVGAWANSGAWGQTAPTPQEHAGAYVGYTLIAPMNSRAVTLIDMEGQVVHTWQTSYVPGAAVVQWKYADLLGSEWGTV